MNLKLRPNHSFKSWLLASSIFHNSLHLLTKDSCAIPESYNQLLPDAGWCAYFIGKDIFNNALSSLLWSLFNNDFLHHLLKVICELGHKKTNKPKHNTLTAEQNAADLGLPSAAGPDSDWSFPSAPHRLLHHRNWLWFRCSDLLWTNTGNIENDKWNSHASAVICFTWAFVLVTLDKPGSGRLFTVVIFYDYLSSARTHRLPCHCTGQSLCCRSGCCRPWGELWHP